MGWDGFVSEFHGYFKGYFMGTHKVQNFEVFWVLPLGTREDWVLQTIYVATLTVQALFELTIISKLIYIGNFGAQEIL